MKLRAKAGKITALILLLIFSTFLAFGRLSGASETLDLPRNQAVSLPNPDRFVVAVMGDCRTNTEAMEKNILDAKTKSDFAFLLGDLVSRGERANFDFFVNELNESQGNFPVYTAIGNHDLDRDGGHQLYEKYFGSRHYWLKAGAALFVVIDNVEEKEFDAELKWMDQVLKTEAGSAQLIFLMMHQPPYTLYRGKPHSLSLEQTGRLMEVAHRYPVSAIFSSHIHDYMAFSYEGIPVYITGEAGAPQKKDIPSYGYLLLRVQDGQYQAQRVVLGNIPNQDRLEKYLLLAWYRYWPATAIGLVVVVVVLIFSRMAHGRKKSLVSEPGSRETPGV